MKPSFLLAGAVAVLIAGCDQQKTAVEELQRKNSELQSRLEEQERMAKVKAAEDVAAKQAATNEDAARKLADDRAALEVEKAKLTEAQRVAAEEDFRRREDAIKAEERRLADAREMSARQAADARERERREAEARERDVPAARPVATTRTIDLFYDSLDPYGDWMEVEGYGYVFQPGVVRAAGWRPYQDGCWAHTDHGWAWKSNEPFGWATYHYGRWIRMNRRGWVWVPGSEWAPAWVSWRRNDDYIGWAPLPPEAHCASGFNSAVDEYYDIGAGSYVFVPHRHFCGGNTYIGRVIDPERSIHFVHQTVNITNITYQKVNQQTVLVNAGPEFAMVRAASAVPVPTLRVQRLDKRDAHDSVASSLGAGVLAMFAPALTHVSPQAKPKSVKFKEARDVDRGWKGVEPNVMARIRERNAAEARQSEARQRAVVSAAPPVVPRAPVAPATLPAKVPFPHPVGAKSPAAVANPPPAPLLPANSTPPTPGGPAPVPALPPKPVVAPPQPVTAPAIKPAPVPKVERPAAVQNPPLSPYVSPPVPPTTLTPPTPGGPVPALPPKPATVPQKELRAPPVSSTPSVPQPVAPPQRSLPPKPVPVAPPPPAKAAARAPLARPTVAPQPVPIQPSGNFARPLQPTPTPKGPPTGATGRDFGRGGLKKPDGQ